jgi:hypothetical protein
MDEQQFDRVARQLAAGIARRDVVRGLVGGTLGSSLALLGWRAAGVKAKDKPPYTDLGETGCNKNQPCPDYYLAKPICYHGRCCYAGPDPGYGCAPGPNSICCSGVCDAAGQCTPV